MRRQRHDGTKVWHNPDVDSPAARRTRQDATSPQREPEQRAERHHRAALEALFTPKAAAIGTPGATSSSSRQTEPPGSNRDGLRASGSKPPGRIVLPSLPQTDGEAAERQRLLSRLLAAEGRPSVSKAANEFLRAGFAFPDEQDVHLQLLEHADETHVQLAIGALGRLLVNESPKRRAVLESRLRRIEEFADEAATRGAAEDLRRRVNGRSGSSSVTPPRDT